MTVSPTANTPRLSRLLLLRLPATRRLEVCRRRGGGGGSGSRGVHVEAGLEGGEAVGRWADL